MHASYASTLYNQGRWFVINRDLVRAFSFEEAFVIGYLCNRGTMFEGDWIPCSSTMLRKHLHLTRYKEERLLRKMADKGILARKMIGVPAKRHFYLHYDRIHDLVIQACRRDGVSCWIPPNTPVPYDEDEA